MIKSPKLTHRASLVCAIAGLVVAAFSASADVVETVSGSTIRGKVIASDDGTIKVETDFAGVVSIKQDQVKSVTTDAPINVALKDGTTTKGALDTSGSTLRVNTATGVLSTQTAALTAVWRDGDKSPADKALDALRRKWAYQVGFDLNGKKGNTDRMFIGTDFRAVLKSPADRLAFYGRYARGEEEDTVTQDEAKGGIDYTNYFSEKVSWYARTELGFDRTKELDLRSQTAAGLGYRFYNRKNWNMEGRAGLNYRFESYTTAADFDSAGLDFGFINRYDFSWGRMTNLVTFTPSFDDFANYVLLHESAIELPIGTAKFWRLRFGIRNDYTSEPPDIGSGELDNHDWSYFTQLILNWE